MRPTPTIPTLLATAFTALVLALPLTAAPPPLPAGAEEAAALITPAALEGPIRFLADDLLEGRGPASRGDALARKYIASQLGFLGLRPGGQNGSWEQPIEVLSVRASAPKVWSFAADGKKVDLAWHEDYIAGSGVPEAQAKIDGAEVVFVGYGIQAPEYGWDDFKGVDLKGKILLMLNNDPDWDPALFAGTTRLYYGRWVYKYESAARQGAAGAIIIHTTPSAGYPWQVVQTSWTGPQFELPPAGEPRIQVKAWATEAATRRLLAAAGKNLDELLAAARQKDFQPVPLGIRSSLTLANEVSRTQTANVLGLLPGSDPRFKDQVVIFSAHHDHLGQGEPDGDKDVIYNGAVDNAAGVSQVLAIARAITSLPQPPRRSVLFLFFAAEEQGLLGSNYYATHPTFLPGRIAAIVNFDGGNIWGKTRDITLIGAGKSSLDQVASGFAAAAGRTVKPDQFPDKGFFYRSDQFNLAKIGVPALYFDEGTDFIGRPAGWGKEQIERWTQVQYHQPSDEWSPDWNLDGMVEDARIGLFCGLAVTETPVLPAWNPGDEFEAARKRALAEAK